MLHRRCEMTWNRNPKQQEEMIAHYVGRGDCPHETAPKRHKPKWSSIASTTYQSSNRNIPSQRISCIVMKLCSKCRKEEQTVESPCCEAVLFAIETLVVSCQQQGAIVLQTSGFFGDLPAACLVRYLVVHVLLGVQ